MNFNLTALSIDTSQQHTITVGGVAGASHLNGNLSSPIIYGGYQPGVTKGDIIDITAIPLTKYARQHRILKINGAIAEVVAIFNNYRNIAYNTTSSTATFSDGKTGQKYADSNVDSILTTYYNNFPEELKAAVIPKTIAQYSFKWGSGSTYTGTNRSGGTITLGKAGTYPIGERNVYLLGIDDIVDYVGNGADNLNPTNINAAFRGGRATSDSLLLRDTQQSTNQVFAIPYLNSLLPYPATSTLSFMPAMTIDLSKTTWTKVE